MEKLELTWDYNIAPEYKDKIETQEIWNQTLFTKINQISNLIYKRVYLGLPNRVKINSKLLDLIKSIDFTEQKEDGSYIIFGRFDLIIDDTMEPNKILIYREDSNVERLKIEKPDFRIVFKEFTNEEGTRQIGFILADTKSEEYQELIKDENNIVITDESLRGEVTIINYEPK